MLEVCIASVNANNIIHVLLNRNGHECIGIAHPIRNGELFWVLYNVIIFDELSANLLEAI